MIVRAVAAAGHTLLVRLSPAHAVALVDTLACSALPASLVDMSCSGWDEEMSRL